MLIVFNRSGHRKLWNWNSKNPNTDNKDWPEWSENGGIYNDKDDLHAHCFACGYTIKKAGKIDCKHCPLDFGKEFNNQYMACKSYMTMCTEKGLSLSETAIKVRDLPIGADLKMVVI